MARSSTYSEVVGNSTAVAISTAYYPDGRTAADAVQALGTQLAVDTASNIVKEFWPDIERKFSKKHAPKNQTGGSVARGLCLGSKTAFPANRSC